MAPIQISDINPSRADLHDGKPVMNNALVVAGQEEDHAVVLNDRDISGELVALKLPGEFGSGMRGDALKRDPSEELWDKIEKLHNTYGDVVFRTVVESWLKVVPRDIPEFTKTMFATINFGGDTERVNRTPRGPRREAVKQYVSLAVDIYNVSVLFVAEPQWVDGNFFSNTGLDADKFTIQSTKYQAGILFVTDSVESFEQTEMQKPTHTDKKKQAVFQYVRDRTFIAKMQLKFGSRTSRKFYAISFHGPSKKELPVKVRMLSYLLTYIQDTLLQEDPKCSEFVLTGDINIAYAKTQALLADKFPKLAMSYDHGRVAAKWHIDYMITSMDFPQNGQAIPDSNPNAENGQAPDGKLFVRESAFDHQAVMWPCTALFDDEGSV